MPRTVPKIVARASGAANSPAAKPRINILTFNIVLHADGVADATTMPAGVESLVVPELGLALGAGCEARRNLIWGYAN